MNKDKPDKQGHDYDPYDPERKSARRRPVVPRMVDLSQPLPPPDPGPAVPRPYAPQRRIKEEDVVPPSDNPLVGWRWMGARLLSRHLWPRDARTNALMVYYSGRKRGRFAEDLFGLAPWLLLSLFDAFFLLEFVVRSRRYEMVWELGIIEFLALGMFSLLYGSIVVGMHLRRTMRTLRIEEILLTRLKHVDIVQGLSIRPLSVQSAGITYNAIIHAALALWTALLIGVDWARPLVLGYVFTFGLFRWYLFTICAEFGGALAMRAHLCLRSPLTAVLRVLLDVAIVLLPLVIVAGCVFGVACGLLSPFGMYASAVGMYLCISILFGEVFKLATVDAMDWCHHYPEEWWLSMTEEEADAELRQRTLFSPWKPIPGRKKIRVQRHVRREEPPTAESSARQD